MSRASEKILEEFYQEFLEQYWKKQCCPYPCINYVETNYLDGAKDFRDFLMKKSFTLWVEVKK
jgi:hypothetical protein